VPDFATVDALKTELDMAYLKGDVVDLMDECRCGLERVKNIVQSLKDFSQIDSDETWHKVDIHQGIDAALSILESELQQKCEVRKDYSEVPEIACRLSQLKQVFVNLLVNAVHAIDGYGTISIRTGIQDDQVWISVSDTGSGIAAEHLPHIFDPFFTTKPVGKGTGLGLSVAYSIVQNHHGRIEVTSQVGSGTTFRVSLPLNQPA
jgi:signal transduction histidine kinase